MSADSLFFAPLHSEINYKQLSQYEAADLFKMGMEYGKEHTDSAFLCFATIAGRYDKKMNVGDKHLCIKSLTRMFAIYYTEYFDYGNAYECLYRADAIRRDIGCEIPSIYLCFGNIYSAIAGSECDTMVVKRAIDSYRKAFWSGVDTGDSDVVHIAFDNLTLASYSISQLSMIDDEALKYEEISTGDVNFSFFIGQWRGMKALGEARYQDAIQCFRCQLDVSGDNVIFRRSNVNTFENLYTAYLQLGDMTMAKYMLDTMEQHSLHFDMKDALMNTYRLKANYCQLSGDTYGQMSNANRHLELRDSLISYQRLMGIEEANFLGRLKEVDDNLREENQRGRIREMIILFLSVILVLIIIFSILLYTRNKQLKDKNKMLYKMHNDNIIETDRLYECIKELQAQKPSREISDEDVRKYKNSSLTEKDKGDIMQRIRVLLDDCDEIYSSEFSISRLSELIGIKTRDVSQVINEMTGSNFHVLINEFRIKEACRRMTDTEHFGCMTLEAISTGVGFKSRSSFTTFFKRFTGLFPSEYLRMAVEK